MIFSSWQPSKPVFVKLLLKFLNDQKMILMPENEGESNLIFVTTGGHPNLNCA